MFCVIQVRKHRNVQSVGLFENIMLRIKVATEDMTNNVKPNGLSFSQNALEVMFLESSC